MELGMIGLGRMGGNMARRLLEGGHQVVGFDLNPDAVEGLRPAGLTGASSLTDVTVKLTAPRVVWIMAPSGDPTEQTIQDVSQNLTSGDVVVDGGNSNYKDSMRRASELADRGLHFVDVGTSGGVWGLKEGYSMMVGGDAEAYARVEPALKTLAPAPDRGVGHVGPAGAGHFVKMVHNGIEYGMMQAYAEGFELMEAKREFGLDLQNIAEIWRWGSVVRSWLLDLTAAALEEDPKLESLAAYVEDSGEGRWTLEESFELGVPMPVIALSLQARFRSRQEQPFGAKLLAAMRNQFGGHAVKRSDR